MGSFGKGWPATTIIVFLRLSFTDDIYFCIYMFNWKSPDAFIVEKGNSRKVRYTFFHCDQLTSHLATFGVNVVSQNHTTLLGVCNPCVFIRESQLLPLQKKGTQKFHPFCFNRDLFCTTQVLLYILNFRQCFWVCTRYLPFCRLCWRRGLFEGMRNRAIRVVLFFAGHYDQVTILPLRWLLTLSPDIYYIYCFVPLGDFLLGIYSDQKVFSAFSDSEYSGTTRVVLLDWHFPEFVLCLFLFSNCDLRSRIFSKVSAAIVKLVRI